MRELVDRSAQGRACGNLGNTHYLLGNFQQAVNYHEEVYMCISVWINVWLYVLCIGWNMNEFFCC